MKKKHGKLYGNITFYFHDSKIRRLLNLEYINFLVKFICLLNKNSLVISFEHHSIFFSKFIHARIRFTFSCCTSSFYVECKVYISIIFPKSYLISFNTKFEIINFIKVTTYFIRKLHSKVLKT